jgi:hypothetical protein
MIQANAPVEVRPAKRDRNHSHLPCPGPPGSRRGRRRQLPRGDLIFTLLLTMSKNAALRPILIPLEGGRIAIFSLHVKTDCREARFFSPCPFPYPSPALFVPSEGVFYAATVKKRRHQQAFPVIASAPRWRGRRADRSNISSSLQWDGLDWRLGVGTQITALRRRRVLHTGCGTAGSEDRYHLFTGWQCFVSMFKCSRMYPMNLASFCSIVLTFYDPMVSNSL